MQAHELNAIDRRVVTERRRRYAAVSPDGQERRKAVRRPDSAPAGRISLDAVRRVAETIARELDPRLRLRGMVRTASGNYVELLFAVEACHTEPCRVTVGVNRMARGEQLRQAIAQSLEAYLLQHPRSDAHTPRCHATETSLRAAHS